jgi:hypothetical protein
LHAGGRERLARAGLQAALVEDGGDLAIAVRVVEQRVDLRDDRGAGAALIACADRCGHLDGLRAATAKADVERDHAIAPGQRDVLDEQRRHPLALAVRRRRVVPQGREVPRELEDALALLVIEPRLVGMVAALVFLSRALERPELLVPARLERVGDEPA